MHGNGLAGTLGTAPPAILARLKPFVDRLLNCCGSACCPRRSPAAPPAAYAAQVDFPLLVF
jgi:hypothetical protein